MRHTKKEIERQAAKLAYALGAPTFGDVWKRGEDGKLHAVIGGMHIERMNPGDGTTYRLCEICTDGGGESGNVVGPWRMTTHEFAIALNAGLEVARRLLGNDEYVRRIQKALNAIP